jgi:hypothetical protein
MSLSSLPSGGRLADGEHGAVPDTVQDRGPAECSPGEQLAVPRAGSRTRKRRVSAPAHALGMASRTDARDHGHRIAQRIRIQLGDDVHEARRCASISQGFAGAAAGMSRAQFGRIERGEIAGLTVDQASRASVAVGLRLVMRTYPDGDPVRDAAQLALLERFRQRLPPRTRWTTEVPLPIPGDRRSWDAVAELYGRRAGCEAETRLRDIQAIERRLALKERDGAVDVLILIVSDTAANRRALGEHREVLRSRLPLNGREILSALRSGRLPDRSGIVVL